MKVAKPVTIIVTEREMLEWPVFKTLIAQGHRILPLDIVLAAFETDFETTPPLALIMGRKAHLLLPGMEACVPVALKKARVELYPPKEAT